jgi:hypothetical protein
MRALILVAAASLALSGCAGTANIGTAGEIDLACKLAVSTANSVEQIAEIAQQHGRDPVHAAKLAEKAQQGADVTGAICTVATAIAPAF